MTRTMVDIFRNLFSPRGSSRRPALPPGQRVYAIGDIHGRLDLFTALGEAIERDDRQRGPADSTVILLGDLIDRGPQSARVIGMAQAWSRGRKVRFLSGNHEEMFLLSFSKSDVFRNFIKHGGRETILSYGVSAAELAAASLDEARALMTRAVPRQDRAFLHGFETMITLGDYLFVHAGIRPDTPLERQTGQDCRWIREPFLSHEGSFGKVVVHGHTVFEDVDDRPNRIGIDTGAFMSGTLTALGLEGTDRWLIQTSDTGERI